MGRFALFLLFLAAAGCQGSGPGARLVLREADRGVVAVPENTDDFPDYYRSHALRLIRDQVGRDYEITREEEYVLGPVTTHETAFRRRDAWNWWLPWKKAESATATDTTTTRNATEYRIYYQKAGVGPAGGSPGEGS